jgi:hypothetical protein
MSDIGFWRLSHDDLAALLRRTDLKWESVRVYLALTDIIIGYGKTHDVVSLGQIAKMTGIHRRHVSRSLAQLESLGLCGKEMLAPQKAKRWVAWPCPSAPELGTTPEAGSAPKAVPGAGSKSVPGAGNHQEIKKEKTPRRQSLDIFEQARNAYPGTKRGLDTEFEAFTKKHGDWENVLPLLLPAIVAQTEWRTSAKPKEFRPAWKGFSAWLYQRHWEMEIPDAQAPTSTPKPTGPNPREVYMKNHKHLSKEHKLNAAS